MESPLTSKKLCTWKRYTGKESEKKKKSRTLIFIMVNGLDLVEF
jgi:hypothetical protein